MPEKDRNTDPKKDQPKQKTREAEQFLDQEEKKYGKIPDDVNLDDRRTSPHERKYS